MLRLSTIFRTAVVAAALAVSSASSAQLSAKLDAAEQRLDEDIKACRPIEVADYKKLVEEAKSNVNKAAKAFHKSGVPIDSKQLVQDDQRAEALYVHALEAAKKPCKPPKQTAEPPKADTPKQTTEPPKSVPQIGGGEVETPKTPFQKLEDEAGDALDDLDDAMDDCDEDAVKKLIPKLEELAKRARAVAKAAKAAGKFSKVDPKQAEALAKDLDDAVAVAKKPKCPKLAPLLPGKTALPLGGSQTALPARPRQWIDIKTGKPVTSWPVLINDPNDYTKGVRHVVPSGDPNSAYDSESGRNFARENGQWIDVKTGKPVTSWPVLINDPNDYTKGVRHVVPSGDPNSAYDSESGRNFAREEVPEPTPSKSTSSQTNRSASEINRTAGSIDSAAGRINDSAGAINRTAGSIDSAAGRIDDSARAINRTAGSTGGTAARIDATASRILAAHNAERATVGAQPLEWDPQLAAGAAAYAEQLARTGQRVHAPREGRETVRENLNQGMLGWNTDQMMQNWLNEKRDFTPGIFPKVCVGDWTRCGHYSQMIWPTTTDLGCGMASGSGYQWLVCRYSPGGNKEGKPVGYAAAENQYCGSDAQLSSCKGAGGQFKTKGRICDSAGGSGQVNKANLTSTANDTCKTVEQPKASENVEPTGWIDVKTGKPVTSRPVVTTNGHTYYIQADIGDPNRAFDPESGRNFAKINGEWIDVKTGKPVTSRPVVTTNGHTYYIQADIGDPNRAFDPESGRNFAKVPVVPTPGN